MVDLSIVFCMFTRGNKLRFMYCVPGIQEIETRVHGAPHVPLWLCVPPQPLHWFVLIRHVHKTTIKMASWDLLGTVDQALDTSDCVVLFNLDIPMIPPWILNEAWTKTRAAIGSLSATAMETWRDPGICNTKPKLGWLFHSRVQQFPKVSEPYLYYIYTYPLVN